MKEPILIKLNHYEQSKDQQMRSKNLIEELIFQSLKELIRMYYESNTSKLIFPQTRGDRKRISEQEARFLFVKQLEKQKYYQYAVEVPTRQTYSFTGKGERSGNIDLCLYEDGRRKSLIEFKALNPKQSSYSKDFEKLLFDSDNNIDCNILQNFFIQIFENKNDKITHKFDTAIKDALEKHKEKRESDVIIYICILNGNSQIIKYIIEKNKIKKVNSYEEI